MPKSCRLFATEYSRHFIDRGQTQAEIIEPRDYFSERISEGEIDPRVASIPTKLDEAAEQLVYKHILDNARSVYQVTFKDPRTPRDEEHPKEGKGEDFENQLLEYIKHVYFEPDAEKVLAPPVTTKRMLGYIRPQLLRGILSMYQDTFGRTGATIMMHEYEKAQSRPHNGEATVKKSDPCADLTPE